MATIEDYLSGNIEEGGLVQPLSPIRPMEDVYKLVGDNIDHATEITVTFMEVLHQRWREEMLKDIVEKTLKRVLRKEAKYIVVLIGEHSEVGRFHYHGIFRGLPNDVVAKMKRNLQRNVGRTEIKAIRYTESYQKYMFKSYKTYPPEKWCYSSYIALAV